MKIWNKNLRAGGIILICALLLSLQSCALLTSFRNFSLERSPELSFYETKTFYDGNSSNIIFYEDGSCLLINISTKERIVQHLNHINYRIYGRLSDNFFHWGIYNIRDNIVQIEFLEKIDQWGFMGITRWNGILIGQELKILSGPVNRKGRNVYAPTFDYEGMIFYRDKDLQEINIYPEKAWVNK